jgi:glycosyltransferase involved in cell wall biosynthesis
VTRSGDEEGLAASLRVLLEDPSLRAKLGEANQAEVRTRFSMETMMSRYEHLYSSVAGTSISKAGL